MKNVCAALAAFIALQLCAAPVLAKHVCGNGVVEVGEQCEVPAIQPSPLDAACPGMCDVKCKCPPVTTKSLTSKATPANSPGTKDVLVTNTKLITQFGNKPKLNKATYTRFQPAGYKGKPDAILILIPGFEGGANDFRILAQNLMKRMSQPPYSKHIEVWGFDRRTNQLEDTKGLDLAETKLDPMLGINWLFGHELSLSLEGLPKGRRAVFYDQADVPFMANWTNLVFSRDIDAVVNKALGKVAKLGTAKNKNVFLGGHSMGTVFTTRYASTDFNINPPTCAATTKPNQPSQPGYKKLRGLVLLEGNGWGFSGSTAVPPPALSEDSLDRIIAKADGGLYGALSHNDAGDAGRCVDGTTPCTIANEATTCFGKTPPKCTLSTAAYATVSVWGYSAVNPRVDAQAEPLAIQAVNDLNTHEGISGTSGALDWVTDLAALKLTIPHSTVEGGFGSFLDKDSDLVKNAPFLAMSLGEPGPWVGSCPSPIPSKYMGTSDCLLTWKDLVYDHLTPEPSAGPQPTDLSSVFVCSNNSSKFCMSDTDCPGGTCNMGKWGEDKEVTRLDRVLWAFMAGKTNFTDWYYPVAGPSTTSVGTCSGTTAGTCLTGKVGDPCSGDTQADADAECTVSIILDSTQLSLPESAGGRGRCDIENLTQVGNIDIPVIGFGGSQGLAPVTGAYIPFAKSIATCTAPKCDGITGRVVYEDTPNTAFPTFGDVKGGYEVYMNIGFAHLDVCSAEDTRNDECTDSDTPYACCTGLNTGTCVDNNVVKPLSDFINRNIIATP
jgi:pimeloyl-ACP methyl ester carboxylesterase